MQRYVTRVVVPLPELQGGRVNIGLKELGLAYIIFAAPQ
jgi:hypothetical protein